MWSDIYLLFQGDLENIVQSSFCGNFFLSLLCFDGLVEQLLNMIRNKLKNSFFIFKEIKTTKD